MNELAAHAAALLADGSLSIQQGRQCG